MGLVGFVLPGLRLSVIGVTLEAVTRRQGASHFLAIAMDRRQNNQDIRICDHLFCEAEIACGSGVLLHRDHRGSGIVRTGASEGATRRFRVGRSELRSWRAPRYGQCCNRQSRRAERCWHRHRSNVAGERVDTIPAPPRDLAGL